MSGRRRGIIIAGVIVSAVAGLLYATRYETRERGVRLSDFPSGEFTIFAWSYGTWVRHKEGSLTVETFSGPYTVLVAIQHPELTGSTIEILQTTIVDSDGQRRDVLPSLAEPIAKVQRLAQSVVHQPYAPFRFDDLLKTAETVEIELQFQVKGSDDRQSVNLTLEGYEKTSRSFTFWEAMMSV